MSIIIDVFLAAVILIAAISGVTKGFVRSVINILTFAASFICGWLFTPALSEYYLNTVFMNRVSDVVQSAISAIIGPNLSLDKLFADKPDAFTSIIDRYLIDFTSLSDYFSEASGEGSADVTAVVSRYIAAPIAQLISNVLAFLTIFFAVFIVLKIAAIILDLIFKLPGLSAVNRIAGLLFGLCCGVMYAWIFAIVISAASPALIAMFPDTFTSAAVQNSYLLNIFTQYNLWTLLHFKL